jgi:hypothetical protein
MQSVHKFMHLAGRCHRGFAEYLQPLLASIGLFTARQMLLQRRSLHARLGELLRRGTWARSPKVTSTSDGKMLVSRREAAAILSIGIRGVDYMIADVRLTSRRVANRVLIPSEEIRKFVQSDRRSHAPHRRVPRPWRVLVLVPRVGNLDPQRSLGQKCTSLALRSRSAAASAVMSRCGMPSISKPTMNFRTVAERSSGG